MSKTNYFAALFAGVFLASSVAAATAPARASFSSGFTSKPAPKTATQKPSPTEAPKASNSGTASATHVKENPQNTSFGAFGRSKANGVVQQDLPANTSAVSAAITKRAVQSKALAEYDARVAAANKKETTSPRASVAPGGNPNLVIRQANNSFATPHYSSGTAGNSTPSSTPAAPQAQAPVIVHNNSNNGNALAWFMLGQSMSRSNSGGYAPVPAPVSQAANSVVTPGSGADTPSGDSGFVWLMRCFAWACLLGVFAYGIYFYRTRKTKKEVSSKQYSLN